MQTNLHPLVAALTLATIGVAQQSLVVPGPNANSEALAHLQVPGAGDPVRQQILVGASHLTAMLGRTITALEFRRNGENFAFTGGVVDMAIQLSIAPITPLQCSNAFANNQGPSPVAVFSGQVVLPASAAITTPPATWSAPDTARIVFTTPFVYTGGTLCLDLTGTPAANQVASWWVADATAENLGGTTTDLGGGCGPYGGVQHRWSDVARRSLVPGAYARFTASGTPGGLALLALGDGSVTGLPLAWTGLPALPGCDVHLANLLGIEATVFVPPTHPLDLPFGGWAEIELKLPETTAAFGIHLAAQWLDWTQVASSNAIDFTIAQAIPSIDMAVLDGHPLSPTGLVAVHLAHVLRFEFQ